MSHFCAGGANITFVEGAKMWHIFLRGKKLNFLNTAVSYLVEPWLFKTFACELVTGVGLRFGYFFLKERKCGIFF